MFEFSLDLFIVLVICISFVTIGILLYIFNREDVIKLYLKFKSPNEKVDKIIDDKFKELKLKWVNYNKIITSLRLQFYILLVDLIFSLEIFPAPYLIPKSPLLVLAVVSIMSLIIVAIFYYKLGYTLSSYPAFRVELVDKLVGTKKFGFFIFLLQCIPILIIIFYIKIKSLEYNIDTGIILYSILTAGLYKYIDYFFGIFLPISESRIDSAEELIKSIEKQTKVRSSFENSIQNNHEKSMHEHG